MVPVLAGRSSSGQLHRGSSVASCEFVQFRATRCPPAFYPEKAEMQHAHASHSMISLMISVQMQLKPSLNPAFPSTALRIKASPSLLMLLLLKSHSVNELLTPRAAASCLMPVMSVP